MLKEKYQNLLLYCEMVHFSNFFCKYFLYVFWRFVIRFINIYEYFVFLSDWHFNNYDMSSLISGNTLSWSLTLSDINKITPAFSFYIGTAYCFHAFLNLKCRQYIVVLLWYLFWEPLLLLKVFSPLICNVISNTAELRSIVFIFGFVLFQFLLLCFFFYYEFVFRIQF